MYISVTIQQSLNFFNRFYLNVHHWLREYFNQSSWICWLTIQTSRKWIFKLKNGLNDKLKWPVTKKYYMRFICMLFIFFRYTIFLDARFCSLDADKADKWDSQVNNVSHCCLSWSGKKPTLSTNLFSIKRLSVWNVIYPQDFSITFKTEEICIRRGNFWTNRKVPYFLGIFIFVLMTTKLSQKIHINKCIHLFLFLFVYYFVSSILKDGFYSKT